MKRDMADMAGIYAVGALSPEEAAEFEAYLDTSPEARAEVAEFLATTARLGEAEAATPPDSLRGRVLDEVSRTRQEPPLVTSLSEHRTRWRRVAPTIAAAAAVVLLAVAGVVGVRLGNRVDDLEAERAVLTAADAVTIELDGAEGSLRVLWSQEQAQLAVIGNDVAIVTENETYELWRLSGDRIEAVGLFRPGADGTVLAFIDSTDLLDGGSTGLAVTVEPAGGVDQPTGDIVFLA